MHSGNSLVVLRRSSRLGTKCSQYRLGIRGVLLQFFNGQYRFGVLNFNYRPQNGSTDL